MKPRIVVSKCVNIFKNLACEELFAEDARAPVLFLYRNSRTIVLGRNQNPWKEVHIERVKADDVALCRRKSGGGAVYQDLGNMCFSFINPNSPQEFKTINNSMILRALNILDIDAETSGRNDLTVEGKKISGSAYKIQNLGSTLHTVHHGTMLINTDFSALVKYLNPHRAKLESKGISSVSSRVTNLVEFNPEVTCEKFVESMIKSFGKNYPDADVVHLDGIPPVAVEKAKAMEDWNWVYGVSPQFTYNIETRFKWGMFDMHFDVKAGVVEQCKIFSDCLVPDFVQFVEHGFVGQKYGKEATDYLKSRCPPDYLSMLQDVQEWFLSLL